MTLSARDKIDLDYDRAHDFVDEYSQAMNDELFARGLQFTTAIQKFTTFFGIKVTPTFYETYLNIAFLAVSALQPELFLVKFLGEEEKTVKAAWPYRASWGINQLKSL